MQVDVRTQVKALFIHHAVPQAMLWIGSNHLNLLSLARELMAHSLCHKSPLVCGVCQPCHLLQRHMHPDIREITPESAGGSIKIDQIRELQSWAYQTPQIGDSRFIVLEPVDKLNLAAANALLKILEEPPPSARFILISECLDGLPKTIVSRTQKYVFPSSIEHDLYAFLGSHYEASTLRRQLFEQQDDFIQAIKDIMCGRVTVCSIAEAWSQYALGELLWFLYLLIADMIKNILTGKASEGEVSVGHLFEALAHLTELRRYAQQNIALNASLAIESLLFFFKPSTIPMKN